MAYLLLQITTDTKVFITLTDAEKYVLLYVIAYARAFFPLAEAFITSLICKGIYYFSDLRSTDLFLPCDFRKRIPGASFGFLLHANTG